MERSSGDYVFGQYRRDYECSARGFFQDQKDFIEGDLGISFVALEDFDYRNIIVNYYSEELSY